MESTYFFNTVLPRFGARSVRIVNRDQAHCICPGADLHTTWTGATHTTAYWNSGRPWIHCYHTACRDVVLAANRAIRRQFSAGFRPANLPTASPLPSTEPFRELALMARQNKWEILERYQWDRCLMRAESPYPLDDDPVVQTLLHLSLFDPDDVIWIGQLKYTGKTWSVKNFRRRDDWLPRLERLSPYICPSIFRPKTYSRSDTNVAGRRFLVVESDSLSKCHVGGIFRLLMHHLTLRAVVDTGNKSLHGWFDYPEEDCVAMLKAFLPELGCDPKMFGASQPCRLAGQVRDNGNMQQLIYLNPVINNIKEVSYVG